MLPYRGAFESCSGRFWAFEAFKGAENVGGATADAAQASVSRPNRNSLWGLGGGCGLGSALQWRILSF